MQKGIIQTLKFLTFLAVGVLLLWFAFHNVDFSKLGQDLKQANYSWILLSVFFASLAFVSRARRWVLLINTLGFKPSFWNSFHAMMTGYLANIALPRIGEITRCVALGKKEKIPVDQLIGTVVIERTIDFISLLTIMVILIFSSGGIIGSFLKESILIPVQDKVHSLFGNSMILWLILLLMGVVLVFMLYKFRKRLRKFRFFSKMFDLSRGIISGLKSITNLERKWEFIFHSVFIWICYIFMTWVVVFSLKSTSGLSFGDGVFLLVIGGLAMSAPVQSGLGAFHYIVSRGLLIVKGIPLEDGLVYAILTHETELIYMAILGTISFFILSRKSKSPVNLEVNSLAAEEGL